MSTSPILPAGFFITTIGGQRCTAVPRASTTLPGSIATEAAAQPPATSTTLLTSTTTPAAGDGENSAATTAASTVTPEAAAPASKGTTPTVSSSTDVPQAQSEFTTSSASSQTFTILNGGGSFPAQTTSSSSLLPVITMTPGPLLSTGASSSNSATGPIVGGVIGSMSFIALVAFLFWFLRRKKQRDSLLTPLGTREPTFDERDGPSEKISRWKYELNYQADRMRSAGAGLKEGFYGFGASLKSKVKRDQSDTPSVDLNRGNSQFLDGPIPQHSRNNSSVQRDFSKPTMKERATDLWEKVGDKMSIGNWRLPRKSNTAVEPFTVTRKGGEKQSGRPNLGPLLSMSQQDLQNQADRRRASLSSGSLNLNFESSNPSANPFSDPSNPFSDPPTRPEASIPKSNTYIADIRRSRGQSIDATTTANNASNTFSLYRPPSTAPGSRYPSTIAPSRDSYRDTVFSSFSASARKGKGRSDPFDLERPELWRPTKIDSMVPLPLDPTRNINPNGNGKAQTVLGMEGGGSQMGPRTTYDSSKYSSGVSAMSEWGEPGPDVEPGSVNNENVLGNGMGIYEEQQQQQHPQMVGVNRDRASTVSRVASNASSRGGVGKAM